MTDIAPTSPLRRLLVANRGEVACRILRAAAELEIDTVVVFPADDAATLHARRADRAVMLDGQGPAAYLDALQLVDVAIEHGCDAVHPGYGFLSENAEFARAVEAAGLKFVGPTPEQLMKLANKQASRRLAEAEGLPVLPATGPLTSSGEAEAFVAEHGPTMLKAVAGGGGRGLRAVTSPTEVATALARCRSEAAAAFGNDAVYAERRVEHARHLEVQVIGDGSQVTHLWERECSLQRQHQKIIEYAPAPGLDTDLRQRLLDSAVCLAAATQYRGLGTVEFIVDRQTGEFYFLEVNARLQVEHTVSEEITGCDLVQAQLHIAAGASLSSLGLATPPLARGQAVQLRVNAETMRPDGSVKPATGTLQRFEIPSGRGVRTESHGTAGYELSPRYDSLLAKVVVHTAGDLRAALRRADQALATFAIEGVETNVEFLRALIALPAVQANDVSTRFVGDNSVALLRSSPPSPKPPTQPTLDEPATSGDTCWVLAPQSGTVIELDVAIGQRVDSGAQLLVLEAMKMEHVVNAAAATCMGDSGATGPSIIERIDVAVGDTVTEGQRLVCLSVDAEASDGGARASSQADIQLDETEMDLERVRPDLAEVAERHGYGHDENRLKAVAKRHAAGKRTARENVADLTDEGSFVEWGALTIAAQRRRRPLQELIEATPGDGLVGGIGAVNSALFGADEAQCMVVTYDYMVMAGTQGYQNHRKKDRLFELAKQLRLPVVLFAEGGGGRPGDTDPLIVAGLDCRAFTLWAGLSGLVPRIGINAGYCFAGNAALLGSCDVIIATADSNVGMGGPAMIEGAGLGTHHPKEIGPIADQESNGVVDIVVRDEAEAVAVAKQYLAYFQGRTNDWQMADQHLLRHLVPENRRRIYDVRRVIDTMFDADSVLELRRGFAPGMITCLARIEGRPVGVLANDPAHQAGAIEADGAGKASRFMQLCDAFRLPLVTLCDTPGFMVGPAAERTGLVRHACRMFVTAASLSIPICTLVLRKGYGLGAQAMACGGFKEPIFTVAWPSGEFGAMGLEGAVKLGFRAELAAISNAAERAAAYQQKVDELYELGKGLSMADHFEIDDVIDPAESRGWIVKALQAAGVASWREGRRRPFVDTW